MSITFSRPEEGLSAGLPAFDGGPRMAKADEGTPPPPKIRLVDSDRVKVEFLIDDLIRQIGIDKLSPIASCNGCNTCAAVVALPEEEKR